MRSRSGFTLIELLVVVAIIGILASIATVNFQNALRRAKFTSTKSLIQEMDVAIKTIQLDEKRYPRSYNLYQLGKKLLESSRSSFQASAKNVHQYKDSVDPYATDVYGNTISLPVAGILTTALGGNYASDVNVHLDQNETDGVGPIIVDAWGTPIMYISSDSYCPNNRCNSDPNFGTSRVAAYEMSYDTQRQPENRLRPINPRSFQLISFGENKDTSDPAIADTCGLGCYIWDDDLDNDGDGKKDSGDEKEDDIINN